MKMNNKDRSLREGGNKKRAVESNKTKEIKN